MSDQPKSPLTDEQKSHLQRMKDTDAWPMWPWLPLKRRVTRPDGLTDTEVGTFYMDLKTFFPGHNIFVKITSTTPSIKTTPEDLVAQGWIVD